MTKKKDSSLAGQSFWGVADQAVVSLTNLGIGLLLIKTASKDEFGLYGLSIAAILYLVGIANALITTQMLVLAPRYAGKEEDRFCLGLLKAQHLLHGFLALLLCLLLSIVFYLGLIKFDTGALIFIVVLTSGGVLLKEFMRRYLYLKRRAHAVFYMDLAHLVLILGGFMLLIDRYATQQYHLWALLLIGISALLVSLASLIKLHGASGGAGGLYWWESFRHTWDQGRWALGGVTVTWGQNQGFLYLLALLAGSPAVAEVNAARMFMAPSALVSAAANNVTLPSLARHITAGRIEKARHIATRIMLVLSGLVIGYCLLLLAFQSRLLELLEMKEYRDTWFLTALWGVIFLLQVLRTRSSLLMQSSQRFRDLMWANLASAMMVLIGLLLLIPLYQERGSLVAVAIGEALLGLILWRLQRRADSTLR